MGKKKILWIIGLMLIFTILGLYWLIQYLLSPYRAYTQFLKAIEQKDIDTIYSFILEDEKKDGLRKETVQRLIDWMFYRHAPKVRGETVFISPPADRWFRAGVQWTNAETGEPLMLGGRKILGYINLFRPPKRWSWQVSFTHFVKDYLSLNVAPLMLRQQGWTKEKVSTDYGTYERLKDETVLKILSQLGIRKIFQLPSKTKIKGRYIVIWEKK